MTTTTAQIRLSANADPALLGGLNATSNQVTALGISARAVQGAFAGLEKVTRGAFGTIALGKERAEQLGNALGKVTTQGQSAFKVISKASDVLFIVGQVKILTKGLGDAADALTRVPQTLGLMEASGVTTRTIGEFQELQEAIKLNGTAMENFSIDAVSRLNQFEQGITRVQTILRSSSRVDEFGNAMRANAEEARENGNQIQALVNGPLKNAISSVGALAGQYEVLSGGFVKAEDSQKVLEASLKLSSIGGAGGETVDVGETSRLVTKTLRAYELGADSAAKTGAILNGIVEQGVTTVQELSLGFGQTSTVARQAGISISDLAAATAVLTAQGTNTPTALTGVEALSRIIIDKTPEAASALKKLRDESGKPIKFDIAEIRTKGFVKALQDLNKAVGGNAQKLSEVIPESLAFSTALALLSQNGEKFAQTAQTIGSLEAGSLDEVFSRTQEDRVARFQAVANRFGELIIKVGQSVAPVFEPGIAALEGLANLVTGLPEPVKAALGSFIAFNLTLRAGGSAAGILIKTFFQLGAAYLQVRLLNLAFTGQLGKELGVIGQLITQRKGLLSAGLQLLGVDQRFRLETEAVTAAVQKQSGIMGLVGQVQARVGNVVKANVAGFQATTNALGKQTAAAGASNATLAQLGQTLANLGQRAKTVVLGAVAQIAPDAQEQALAAVQRARLAVVNALVPERQLELPLFTEAQAGLNAINGAAIRTQQAVAGLAQNFSSGLSRATAQTTQQVQQLELALGGVATASTAQTTLQKTALAGNSANLQVQRQLVEASQAQIVTLQTKTLILENSNRALAQDTELTALQTRATQLNVQATEAQVAANTQQLATEKALVVASEQRLAAQRALALSQSQPGDVGAAALAIQSEAQAQATEAAYRRDLQRQRQLEARAATLSERASQAEAAATTRTIATQQQLAPSLQAVTRARQAEVAALNAGVLAQAARARASTLEKASQLSAGDLEAAAAARQANALATGLESKALNLRTRATVLATNAEALLTEQQIAATVATRAAALAERGLTESRIFGNTVAFANTGLLSGLNNVLSANVLSATSFRAAFTRAGVAGKGFFGVLQGIGGVAGGAAQLGLKGLGAAGNALQPILASVGLQLALVAPLLVAGSAALFIFRDRLFGLGAAAREADSAFKEFRKTQEEVKGGIIRTEGISQATYAVSQLKEQIESTGKTGDLTPIEKQLKELKTRGVLTRTEFEGIQVEFAKTGQVSRATAEDLDRIKRKLGEISQIKKPDQGIVDAILGGIGQTPGAILKSLDNVVNSIAAVTTSIPALLDGKNLFEALDPNRVAVDRQADSLIRPLSQIRLATEEVQNQFLETKKAVIDYNNGLLLSDEANQKLGRGLRLTAADLQREADLYGQRKKDIDTNIASTEKLIEAQQKVIDKTTDPKLKEAAQEELNVLKNLVVQQQKVAEESEAASQAQLKYQTETIPTLQRAITQQANPLKAISEAQDAFSQKEQEGFKGRLKSLETLQNETAAYQNSVGSALEQNAITGEEAAARLRDSLEQATVTINGQSGNYLPLEQRKALIAQIADLEAGGSKERIAQLNVQQEEIKAQQAERVITTQEADKQISQLQVQAQQEQLKQLEKQIVDYTKYGIKTTELEQQAATLRAQIRQAEAERKEKEFQIELEKRKQQLQIQTQAEVAIQQKAVNQIDLEIKGQEIRRNLVQSQQSLLQSQGDFSQKLLGALLESTRNTQKRLELERQIAQLRLQALERSQAFERESLLAQQKSNALALDKEQIQNRIAQLQNQQSLAQGKLDLLEAQRQKQTPEQIKLIQQQVSALQEQGQVLGAQGGQIQLQRQQQPLLDRNALAELENRQTGARVDAALEVAQSIRAPGRRARAIKDLREQFQGLLPEGLGVAERPRPGLELAGGGVEFETGGLSASDQRRLEQARLIFYSQAQPLGRERRFRAAPKLEQTAAQYLSSPIAAESAGRRIAQGPIPQIEARRLSAAPRIQAPGLQSSAQTPGPTGQDSKIEKLVEAILVSVKGLKFGDFNSTINNYFQGEQGKQVGSDVKKQTLEVLREIGLELTQGNS